MTAERATAERATAERATAERGRIGSLVARLIDDVGTLVQQELRLARAEGSEKLSEVTTGLISVAAGLLIALAALLVLVQALVVALAKYMPDALAALLVGLVLALVAFLLMYRARNALSTDNLALPRTRESLRQDKDTIMETVR